ncbi:MAG TPA: cobalt ECF transporter T component CbiQ [Candidatus Limnocylindrales bacterium]|nr:cobalt ECF transporter T component CbiQ [Candidatus Limnocylindrales bacterium]
MNLDRYLPRDSPLHRADPRLKLIAAVATILAITLLPVGAFVALAVAWLAIVLVALWARVGPLRVARNGLVAAPFALAAIPLVFTRPEDPLGTLTVGPLMMTISGEGLRMLATILLKSWLSVQVAVLLAFTTPFHELIDALRELRVPRIFVAVIGFMYRYLGVLGEEAGRMSRARAARSAAAPDGRPDGGSVLWRARVTGSMVGSLFIRSYERSERIIAAMQSRGFESELRHMALTRPPRMEVVALLLLVIGLLIYVAAAHLVAGR